MMLETLKSLVRTETMYSYQCNVCGEEWETTELRHSAECPDCGGPPVPATETA